MKTAKEKACAKPARGFAFNDRILAVDEVQAVKPEKLRKFTIKVLSASNLKAADLNGKSDPFCKIFFPESPKKSLQKTATINATLNPVWNETFEFHYTKYNKSLCLEVYDFDMGSADEFLGKLEFTIPQLKSWVGTTQELPVEGRKAKDKVKGTVKFQVLA